MRHAKSVDSLLAVAAEAHARCFSKSIRSLRVEHCALSERVNLKRTSRQPRGRSELLRWRSSRRKEEKNKRRKRSNGLHPSIVRLPVSASVLISSILLLRCPRCCPCVLLRVASVTRASCRVVWLRVAQLIHSARYFECAQVYRDGGGASGESGLACRGQRQTDARTKGKPAKRATAKEDTRPTTDQQARRWRGEEEKEAARNWIGLAEEQDAAGEAERAAVAPARRWIRGVTSLRPF